MIPLTTLLFSHWSIPLCDVFSAALVLEENQLLKDQEAELKNALASQEQDYHAHLGNYDNLCLLAKQ